MTMTWAVGKSLSLKGHVILGCDLNTELSSSLAVIRLMNHGFHPVSLAQEITCCTLNSLTGTVIDHALLSPSRCNPEGIPRYGKEMGWKQTYERWDGEADRWVKARSAERTTTTISNAKLIFYSEFHKAALQKAGESYEQRAKRQIEG